MEPTSGGGGGDIRVGTVLAETYEITELLGQGGMGAVYAAKHLRLPGKRVAVKVLHGVAANDRESYARFRREAEIASRLGHPNIVTVHDFNVLPSGTPYLVLEFLDGEDLAHRLERGALPLEQALTIARQIGSALAAAHRADVVHRDLKPGNVFLVPTEIGGEYVDQVKVLDFGISKIRGSQTVQTQDSVLLGTPQYMAPEQALGKNATIDGRTDIFALGAIVYEMISGKPAFMGSTLAEVVFKVVYDKQAPLATSMALPQNVNDAVEKALAKEQNDRFADVGEFVLALTGRPLGTLERMRAGAGAATSPSGKQQLGEAFAATAPGVGFASTQAASGNLPPAGATGNAGTATTGARGEISPLIPPTRVQAKAGGRGKLVAFVVGAAVAAAVGVVAVKKLTAHPDDATTGTTTTGAGIGAQQTGTTGAPTGTRTGPIVIAEADTKAQPAAAAVAPPPPPIAAAPLPKGLGDIASTGVGAGAGKPAAKAASSAHAHSGHDALPPDVAAALDDADKQIESNPQEAIRVARNSLQQAKSARAYAIITRAYCKLGDLGNANAALHNVGGERARVVKYCKQAGLDLQ